MAISSAGWVGTYSEIDYPGATDTYVDDINNLGDIVGPYIDATGVNAGFFAAPVPIPMTILLFGSGLAGTGWIQEKEGKQNKINL